jgi:predicted molibdopterin-dependent oxidoreductase YjgC
MPDVVVLRVNDAPITMPAGSTVGAAILTAGVTTFRGSVNGEARGPLCGMGICFECRVRVNGVAHVRSCQTLCENNMDVRTDE